MPEDNLIHLYEGTERAFFNGDKQTAPPIDKRMVMIYPKEGSMPRNNCACIVDADWVTEEQKEAARRWIDFIREDEQQRAFMEAGFRPGTDLDLNYPGSKISSEFGLDPSQPTKVLNPSLTRPEVAAAIDTAWADVKRPGIVTLVLDTSGSMAGGKLERAREGVEAFLDGLARSNQVGFVAFDETITTRVGVVPLAQSRFPIQAAADGMRAAGETALYDAIRAGILMSDAAEGPEDAIRAVVVLTDGQANRCQTRLDGIVRMMSSSERSIREFRGCEGDGAVDDRGGPVSRADIIGIALAMHTRHPVQIFFIGIGDDADMQVGRVLAEATGAEFQGAREDQIAAVLAEFGKYF